jgi:hypothetical protein
MSSKRFFGVSQPKKQHFIPQFLLKNFATGKKNKAKIWCFDKKRGCSYVCSVRDAAHENKFYESTNLDEKTIEAENLMRFTDNLSSPAVRDVLSNKRLDLDGAQVVHLSYLMSAQMLRVPNERNTMVYMHRKMMEKWGPNIRYEGDDRPLSAYSAEDSKFSSILTLRSVPEFAKLLQTKIWFLLMAPPNASFTLSDNPVVRHNHLDYGPRGSLGIAQDGIEVNLPISPKFALQCVCPKIAMLLRGTPLGRKMIQLQRLGLPIPTEPEAVTFVNSLQVIHSERYVYASTKSDFDLAIDMLREHPDLSIPASEKTVH